MQSRCPELWMLAELADSLEERNSRGLARRFERRRDGISRSQNGRRVLGFGGEITCGPMRRRRRPTFQETARREWAVFHNPELAWSLEQIAPAPAGKRSTKGRIAAK